MKKIAISLLALAAVSTVAFANDNRGDLRDLDTYFGRYSSQVKNEFHRLERICRRQR